MKGNLCGEGRRGCYEAVCLRRMKEARAVKSVKQKRGRFWSLGARERIVLNYAHGVVFEVPTRGCPQRGGTVSLAPTPKAAAAV